MSIATDIVSLKIMAEVYKKQDVSKILEAATSLLVEEVSYIDWCGIYLMETEKEATLIAASSEQDSNWMQNSELRFQIPGNNLHEAVLVVRSEERIAFDTRDIHTLENLSAALGDLWFAELSH
ncbi:GAF domain-containing protein [Paenalkalicoccus suaedae]|uniref:GAF domain-containing protein n=1 Tax=Paenalkalicoccus suaedae TaxID=2592382 RepID=A0A859FCC0_9BACI|nr:GAF domain-containing protein [Paenalkalicoccus suaedae]QKS70590.1 GAF domain-containing protein [Paenalkalicoccus suaedae]